MKRNLSLQVDLLNFRGTVTLRRVQTVSMETIMNLRMTRLMERLAMKFPQLLPENELELCNMKFANSAERILITVYIIKL